jgi:hypothetical protein
MRPETSRKRDDRRLEAAGGTRQRDHVAPGEPLQHAITIYIIMMVCTWKDSRRSLCDRRRVEERRRLTTRQSSLTTRMNERDSCSTWRASPTTNHNVEHDNSLYLKDLWGREGKQRLESAWRREQKGCTAKNSLASSERMSLYSTGAVTDISVRSCCFKPIIAFLFHVHIHTASRFSQDSAFGPPAPASSPLAPTYRTMYHTSSHVPHSQEVRQTTSLSIKYMRICSST